MELICPSCEARYQLPDGSITGKGRQVSCMNCGHSWHAFPPLMLGDPAAGGAAKQASPPSGIRYEPPGGAPRPGERRVEELPYNEMGSDEPALRAAPPREEPVEAGSAAGPAPGAAGQPAGGAPRTEQLAEIRQMLADVQSEDRAEAATRPDQDQTVVMAAAAGPRLSPAEEEAERARRQLEEDRANAQREAREAEAAHDEEIDESDLRRRIDRHGDRSQAKKTDVRRIQRNHNRRINRKKHASKAGSGAFLTGFLLIAIIAASMVSLYVLSPQIVARVPEAERPMRQYVATMDQLRVGAAESIANLQEWVTEKFGDKSEG